MSQPECQLMMAVKVFHCPFHQLPAEEREVNDYTLNKMVNQYVNVLLIKIFGKKV